MMKFLLGSVVAVLGFTSDVSGSESDSASDSSKVDLEAKAEIIRTMMPLTRFVSTEDLLSNTNSNTRAFQDSKQVSDSTTLNTAPDSEHLSPVIFVAGLTCSKILANIRRKSRFKWYCAKKYDNYTLWLDMADNFKPFEANCFIDNHKLRWDVIDKESDDDHTDSPTIIQRDIGVESFLPGVKWQSLNTTDEVDYGDITGLYRNLYNNLTQELGYQRQMVGEWYYDFRLGPDQWKEGDVDEGSFRRLKKQIEVYYEQANKNSIDNDSTSVPKKRVAIVTVSQGGPVFHQFLNWIESSSDGPFNSPSLGRQWKSKYIERWLSTSGVWGGTSMITSTTVFPSSANLYDAKKKLWWIDFTALRNAITSWPGLHFMQPQFMGKEETLVRVKNVDQNANTNDGNHESDVTNSYKNYSSSPSDLISLFQTIPNLDSDINLIPLYKSLQKWSFKNLQPPYVDVDCMYGNNITVPRSYSYENGLGKDPVILMNDTRGGDGVVNTDSLKMCGEWKDLDSKTSLNQSQYNYYESKYEYEVNVKEFPNLYHGFELVEQRGIDYIVSIIKGIRDKNKKKSEGGISKLLGSNSIFKLDDHALKENQIYV